MEIHAKILAPRHKAGLSARLPAIPWPAEARPVLQWRHEPGTCQRPAWPVRLRL